MRSEKLNPDSAHELEVVDAVVRGGGHARPEDAALTDFALLVRNARPLPDHGAATRLDDRFTAERPVLRSGRRPLLAALATFALVLVVGGVALNVQPPTDHRASPMSDDGGDAGSAGAPITDTAMQKSFAKESERQAQGELPSPIAEQIGDAATVADSRDVAREARLTLATPGARIERLSDQVVAAVDKAHGYVANSSVKSAQGDRGRAEFRLMLNAETFQQTFADLSRLAHVRSRSQSTEDITTEYDAARRSLRQAQERVDKLEAQLADADSPVARASIQRKLTRAKFAERQAQARIRVNKTRTEFVPVDLKIVADSTAADADKGTIARAVDKAGGILTNIAAVLIVLLAVGIPIAVLSGLAILGYRRWHRSRADRTIGEAAAQPE